MKMEDDSTQLKELNLNKANLQLYLDCCEQLYKLEREHQVEKALIQAKINFVLHYGKALSAEQLNYLESISASDLINVLIKHNGKLKLANLNVQYVQQGNHAPSFEYLEQIFKDIIYYWIYREK